jgi:hypothetical protein
MLRKNVNEIPTILMFGSMWGLFQSVLTVGMVKFGFIPWFFEYLHTCPCPLATVLFGIPLMGAGLSIHKKPSMLLGVGLVASSFSFLVIPFLSIPVFTEAVTTYPIINPALANLFASLLFYLVISLAIRKRGSIRPSMAAGISGVTMFLSSSVWIYVVVSIGAPILQPSGLSSPLAYVLRVSPIWAALSALTFPLGYLLASRLQPKVQNWSRANPLLYKTAWVFVFCACWVTSLAMAPLVAA